MKSQIIEIMKKNSSSFDGEEELWSFCEIAFKRIAEEIHKLYDNQWISVKDRLPESQDIEDECNYYCLIYTRNGVSRAMYCNGEWYTNYTSKVFINVTHWMPLPNPPKEKEE